MIDIIISRSSFFYHVSCICSKHNKHLFQCWLQRILKTTQCTVCKNYICLYAYFHELFLLHQYLQYILPSVYQLIFSCFYNFCNLNILQHHMTTRIQINPLSHTPLSINSLLHTCIYHHSNVVYCYKHLYLVYIYTYTFHAILCVLFH